MKKTTPVFNSVALFYAIACAVLCFVSRIISGNPFDMVHKFDGCDIIPPMWIFNLLWVVWYFLIGLAAGGIINSVSNKRCVGADQISSYKGGLFFVASFFLGIIWYAVFFCNQSIFVGMVISITMLICNIICAYHWYHTPLTMSPLIISAYTIWLFYVTLINISVFMHN